MFEQLREALRALRTGAVHPDDRRVVLSEMRTTLAQARVGLDDLRSALSTTRVRLAAERRELDTVRRRKGMAAGISDLETVTVATRFEEQHARRVLVLEQKLAAQEAELAIVERDVEAMTAELKLAAAGVDLPGSRPAPTAPGVAGPDGDGSEQLRGEMDALERQRRRAAAEADAEAKLAALKRRMEK
jgi:hypothetical protein